MSIGTGELPTPREQVHLVVVVPDETAARTFLELTIPSLLAPGNLPAMGDATTWRLRVIATDGAIGAIKGSAAFWALGRYSRPEFVPLSPKGRDPHRAEASALRAASNEAFRIEAAVVMLHARAVYPEGFLDALMGDVRAGTPALAVLPLDAKPGFLGEKLVRQAAEDGHLAIGAGTLVQQALSHLAPATRACFWDAPEVSRETAAVIVQVNADTVIAHAWTLWPVMVRPARSCVEVDDPIDTGRFLEEVLDDPGRAVIVQSSNEVVLVRCSPEHRMPMLRGPMTPGMMLRQRRFRTTSFQRRAFAKPIVVGGNRHDADLQDHVERIESLVQTALVRPVLRGLEPSAGSIVRRVAHSGLWFARSLPRVPVFALRLTRMLRPRHLAGVLVRRAVTLVERIVGRYARGLAQRPGFAREAAIRLHRRTMLALGAAPPDCLRNEAAAMSLQVGLSSLDDGRLDVAHKALDLAWSLRPSIDLEFYAGLTGTLARLKAEAEELGAGLLSLAEDRPRFVFAAVVWGDDYIDNFMQYTVRTMLAPGNLPALGDAHVFFSIVTTEAGVVRIRSHPSFPDLSRYARIHFFVFPEELTKPFHYTRPNFDFYRLYGALDHTSIHFARALKAGIFFIVVDGLLSSNTLQSLRRYLDEGYWICANASIVSNRETLLPALDQMYGGRSCIDISARDLIDLGMAHCHHYIAQRLVVPENRDFDKYPRELYFPTEEGIVVHALYQHPLVISAEAIGRDITFDYFIVDSKLMARILHDPADFPRLKVITDSDEAYVANFAPRSRHFETTGRPLREDDFVAAHLRSEPVHHYIWRHRQILRCNTGLRTNADPEKVSGRLLDALLAAQGRR